MDALEWQVAEGSRTMHVLDVTQNGWRTPAGRRKWCGPRALCGRYPQRNRESPWLAWTVGEDATVARLARSYGLTRCPECLDRVSPMEAD